MRSENPPVIRLADYRAPDFLVDAVDLDIALHPTASRIRAMLSIRPNPAGNPAAALVLDGEELRLDGVSLDEAALVEGDYTVSPETLTLHNPPRRPFTLTIETTVNPTANTKLAGLYRSRGTYCTQCEADGFRRITYFPDRPDVMAVYRVRLEADAAEAPLLLSNGNPGETGTIAETGRHYAVWHDPHPKPAYLFAVVGGDLGAVEDEFTTASGRPVRLAIYVEKGKEPQATYAMDALKRSMRWDETAFGREYDLDVFNIVAVSDFNMGAMENKGLNIFNDKFVLASPETATDGDYALIEAIIAHEYFHNWTGNRITCRDWFQLCLKEGLTVFRDQEFSSDMRSRPVKRIADVRELRARQFGEDSGPLAHPVRPSAYKEINNFYTATVYEKGAEVIRMLKTLIGAEAFQRGMDVYFDRHDGEAATVEQFVACFADTSGRDLTQFMRWYEQAGTPVVSIDVSRDRTSGRLALDIAQRTPPTPGQPHKHPVVVPIRLALIGDDGQEFPLKSGDPGLSGDVFVLTEARQRLELDGVTQKVVPSLLRGFSAPVNLEIELDDGDLLALARHDTDPFNRWQAIQSLATRVLRRSVAAIQRGEAPIAHDGLAAAVGNLLADAGRDPAFAALAIVMPSELELAREIATNVDPDAIHAAREHLVEAIGQANAAALSATCERFSDRSAHYSPDAIAAGRRAVRNAAMGLLERGDPARGRALAEAQFEQATNMTDRFAALAVLAARPSREAETALAAFERRYADNPLVMDKWFGLQAALPLPDTLERVTALMRHPGFTLANPNRVRALLGTFAMANPTQFNRPDGAGHALVADVVLKLDGSNPQVAARILTAFRMWRTLEPSRRGNAEAALRRIAAESALSRDVQDIVERTLG